MIHSHSIGHNFSLSNSSSGGGPLMQDTHSIHIQLPVPQQIKYYKTSKSSP